MMYISRVLIALSIFISASALSYTECTVKTSRLYIGDNGSLWMVFEGGGIAYMNKDDLDFDNTYALLLAAQMADKQVAVRFQESDVQCNTGTRSDITGVWLIK